MKLGISTACFFTKLLTEDSFKEINKLGVDGVETFLTTYTEYEKEFIDLLIKNKGDIFVHSVHTLNTQFEPQLFNDADRTRLDAEKLFIKVCDGANRLGATCYTFHGQSRLKNKAYNIDFDKFSKKVSRLVEIAKGYNVTLTYENVHWALYNYFGFFTELKKRVSDIYGVLDIKQAMQSKVSYEDYIRDMNDSIKTVHLCDYDSNGKLFMPGKGEFDFVKLFSSLKNLKEEPFYILEVYAGNYTNYSEIQASLDYLRNAYEKA